MVNLINYLPLVLDGINETEIQNWIMGYTEPIIDLLIWIIPLAGVIASLANLIHWLMSSNQAKNREMVLDDITKIIFWCLIGEGIVTIFKALGITSSGL